jgi:hypothetical protein
VINLALAGLVVLVIGDSHLSNKDFLLTWLHEGLVAQGATVHTYGVCGSNAHDWVVQSTLPCGRAERHNMEEPVIDKSDKVKVWSLADLIRKHKPDLLIVELGDNMAGYGTLPELPRDWIASQVHEVLKPVAARNLPCIWVGPPWGAEGGTSNKTFARVKDLSTFLQANVAPCRYINSLNFSQPGQWVTYDGEHFIPEAYKIWGTSITRETVQLSGEMRSALRSH